MSPPVGSAGSKIRRGAEVEVDSLRGLHPPAKLKLTVAPCTGAASGPLLSSAVVVTVSRAPSLVNFSAPDPTMTTSSRSGQPARLPRVPYIIVPAVVGRLLKIDIAGVACTKRIVDREGGRKLRGFDWINWIKGRYSPSNRVGNERGCGIKVNLDRGVGRLLGRKRLSGDIDVFDERQRVARTIDVKTLSDQSLRVRQFAITIEGEATVTALYR